MTTFLDTNILLYSISRLPGQRHKNEVALDLIRSGDCALSLQVLNEFLFQATRPRNPDAIPRADAVALITRWRRFPIVPIDLDLFDAALDIQSRTNYSWWDCMIVAAALKAGCDTLATEDMKHGHRIDRLTIQNPFRDAG